MKTLVEIYTSQMT